MLQFQHKEFVWLFIAIPLVILLFIFHLRWKRKVSGRIGDPQLVKELIGPYSSRFFIVKFILLILALVFGVMAAINPRQPGLGGDLNRKGIDLVIALDVSKSMLATDVSPNRLAKARELIYRLMDNMPDDRFALILFAGKSYFQMPLTIDHGATRMYVASAGPAAVPQQGTVISEALRMSGTVFQNKDAKFKTVLLLSDGEDHDEEAEQTARDLASQGVMVNTIGIGSAEGSTIIDPQTGETKKDAAGNTVISKLNEELLNKIAIATHGTFVRLESTDEALKTLQQQFSNIDPQSVVDKSTLDYLNWFFWFATAMFLVLGLEIIIPENSLNRNTASLKMA